MRTSRSNIFQYSFVLSTRYLRTIYAQSLLGFLWLFVRPSINLFTLIIIASVTSNGQENTDFIQIVLSGFLVYDIFSRIVQHTTTSSVYYKNIVRNVSLPIFAVPLSGLFVGIAESFPGLLVSFIVLNSRSNITQNGLIFGIITPVLISAILAFALGLILALMNIWIRDVKNSIGIILQSFMYICPVAYLPNEIPNSIRWINAYNPLCYLISSTRNEILDFKSKYVIENLNHPMIYIIFLLCLIAFIFYKRTAKYIPEII